MQFKWIQPTRAAPSCFQITLNDTSLNSVETQRIPVEGERIAIETALPMFKHPHNYNSQIVVMYILPDEHRTNRIDIIVLVNYIIKIIFILIILCVAFTM